jgi:hypothetical protein
MSKDFIAEPTIDQIPFDSLKKIFKIWRDLQAEHTYVKRKHITPKMLVDHLPYLALIDYEQDSKRFKVRLIGTRYSEAIGFEARGIYIDDLPNSEALLDRFTWLVDQEKPYYACLDEMNWAGKAYRNYAVVGCPLYDDSAKINMILFCVTFERIDSAGVANRLF